MRDIAAAQEQSHQVLGAPKMAEPGDWLALPKDVKIVCIAHLRRRFLLSAVIKKASPDQRDRRRLDGRTVPPIGGVRKSCWSAMRTFLPFAATAQFPQQLRSHDEGGRVAVVRRALHEVPQRAGAGPGSARAATQNLPLGHCDAIGLSEGSCPDAVVTMNVRKRRFALADKLREGSHEAP